MRLDFHLFRYSLIYWSSQACKEHSTTLSGLIVALIRESMQPEVCGHSYIVGFNTHLGWQVITRLDEHGLFLWQSALRNTVTIEGVNGLPGLVELFPPLLQLFTVNLDLLGRIIGLIESYLILGAPLILQVFQSPSYGTILVVSDTYVKHFTGELFSSFLTALQGQAVAVNILDMIKALNLLVQVSNPSQWAAVMHSSGLFSHLLNTLFDNEVSVHDTH